MTNPWKGLLLGAVGGLLGTWAMGKFLQKAGVDEHEAGTSLRRAKESETGGRYIHEGEQSTETVGRLAWHAVTGEDPTRAEKEALAEVAHWGFGATMGALYGALHGSASVPAGGILFGTAVWLVFSELAVPLLGLGPAPARTPLKGHLGHLGGHWIYGLVTAATLQGLGQALQSSEQPASDLQDVIDDMDRALAQEAVTEMSA